MHKSGFVSIIGRPNVGKSTLLNALIKQKLSIVSSKPQTTRSNVLGILDNENYQIIFTDTPGFHKPKHKLGECMIKSISNGLSEVDLILFVANYRKEVLNSELEMYEKIKDNKAPKVFILNKTDELGSKEVMETLNRYSSLMEFDEYIPISAKTGKGVDRLIDIILKNLPEGPKYYENDQTAINHERFFVSEIIREKILKLVRDEIPHGVGVEITSMKFDDKKKKYNIEGNIFCEKDSHKAIIIGKGGSMLKKISTYSREDIEKFLNSKLYIRLWVKVRKNWRDDNNQLKNLGYI